MVIPLDLGGWHNGAISLLPSLHRAARELGRPVRLARAFHTAVRSPGVAVYRLPPSG